MYGEKLCSLLSLSVPTLIHIAYKPLGDLGGGPHVVLSSFPNYISVSDPVWWTSLTPLGLTQCKQDNIYGSVPKQRQAVFLLFGGNIHGYVPVGFLWMHKG